MVQVDSRAVTTDSRLGSSDIAARQRLLNAAAGIPGIPGIDDHARVFSLAATAAGALALAARPFGFESLFPDEPEPVPKVSINIDGRIYEGEVT